MYLEYKGFFARARLAYFRKVLRRLQSLGCRRVLDYGCGPGDVLLLCREVGLEAVGVDNFPRSVELAARHGLRVILGNESSPELAAGSFDGIVLQSVLEHVADPVEFLQRLLVCLRPGGILVLSAPTPGSDFWNDPTHVRPYTPRSLRTLGELLDLEVLEVNYVFAYLLGFRLELALGYKLLNLVPASIGSNLVAFYAKRR